MKKVQAEERAVALHPNTPLPIVVTHEGSEFVRLRALAIEAVPMLLRPEGYPEAKREQIAQGFRHILEDDCLDNNIDNNCEDDFAETENFDEENDGYEPGACLDWPQGEEEQ